MNTTEKRNQIIAMLYQNMDKADADETLNLIDELSTMAVKNNVVLPLVSNSALQNNNKLIENMCISYRHDFGLMKEEEKNELRFECKEWLRAYENNREHCC